VAAGLKSLFVCLGCCRFWSGLAQRYEPCTKVRFCIYKVHCLCIRCFCAQNYSAVCTSEAVTYKLVCNLSRCGLFVKSLEAAPYLYAITIIHVTSSFGRGCVRCWCSFVVWYMHNREGTIQATVFCSTLQSPALPTYRHQPSSQTKFVCDISASACLRKRACDCATVSC
jgi:hypothetical protein